MASAWGNSWGSSWSSSWGELTTNTFSAICIDSIGRLVFKTTATDADKKLYLNNGNVYSRFTPIPGDKVLTLSSGQIIAT